MWYFFHQEVHNSVVHIYSKHVCASKSYQYDLFHTFFFIFDVFPSPRKGNRCQRVFIQRYITLKHLKIRRELRKSVARLFKLMTPMFYFIDKSYRHQRLPPFLKNKSLLTHKSWRNIAPFDSRKTFYVKRKISPSPLIYFCTERRCKKKFVGYGGNFNGCREARVAINDMTGMLS